MARFSRSRFSGARRSRFSAIPSSLPAAVDPLAALYGTGLGQISLHILASDAATDASGNVLSVPNRGGAGAAHNVVAGGAAIAKTGNTMLMPETSAWLDMTSALDMEGTHLMIVSGQESSRWRVLTSSSSGYMQFSRGMTGRRLRLYSGANYHESRGSYSASGHDTSLNLYQIEKAAGRVTLWVNGTLISDDPVNAAVTGPYPITRWFANQAPSADDWIGPVGEIAGVVTDGTATAAPAIDALRSSMQSKYSLTLA